MSLQRGSRLGPFEIQGPIGAGGMGEVYQATDTRLGRTVAIKVLPAELALDPERRERFEHEAKTISSLQHPHICTLYDVGHQDGIDYLVMEHLEGETLQDRLTKGALPLDQALRYAIEIADALDKAHRQDIVHRDLKPGNIMLTKAGAKLLDFGLAKLRRPEGTSGGSASFTRSEALTSEAKLLGTLPYMAPEQLEGGRPDTRTDLWAFGCVVFEMIAGQRPFVADSQASLIGAIMGVDPPALSTSVPVAPASLDRAVSKCFRKARDARWQTASDLKDELQWIADSSSAAAHGHEAVAPGSNPRRWLTTAAAALGLVAVGVIAGFALRPSSSSEGTVGGRFVIPFPAGQTSSLSDSDTVAISGDGRRLVFLTTNETGDSQLYVRGIDDVSPTLVAEGVSSPFLSPDGNWIGVQGTGTPGVIQRIRSTGGAPLSVGPLAAGQWVDDSVGRVRQLHGASWQSDGTIVFGTNGPSGLWRISAIGGDSPEEVSTPNDAAGERNHIWPHVLPNGAGILFTVLSDGPIESAQIAILDPLTGTHRILLTGGTHAVYASTGHIVFGHAGTISAVGFDLDRREVLGQPVPVVEGVSTRASGSATFALSGTGTLFYETGVALPAGQTLVRVDRDGQEFPLGIDRGGYLCVRVSPAGTVLAVQEFDQNSGNEDIFTYDMVRGIRTRLTTHPAVDATPLWTPDGEFVVFASTRGGSWGLYRRRADGTGDDEQLLVREGVSRIMPFGWSADGAHLVFMEHNPDTADDIVVLSMDGSRSVEMLIQSDASEGYGSISPDGRWVAYASNQSGEWQIYVERFPERGQRQQMSTNGGLYPLWSRDGTEIFYYLRDRRTVMTVPVDAGGELVAGLPTRLFGGSPLPRSSPPRPYDEGPDGRLFTVLTGLAATTPSEPSELVVALDWFEELKTRVPVN